MERARSRWNAGQNSPRAEGLSLQAPSASGQGWTGESDRRRWIRPGVGEREDAGRVCYRGAGRDAPHGWFEGGAVANATRGTDGPIDARIAGENACARARMWCFVDARGRRGAVGGPSGRRVVQVTAGVVSGRHVVVRAAMQPEGITSGFEQEEREGRHEGLAPAVSRPRHQTHRKRDSGAGGPVTQAPRRRRRPGAVPVNTELEPCCAVPGPGRIQYDALDSSVDPLRAHERWR